MLMIEVLHMHYHEMMFPVNGLHFNHLDSLRILQKCAHTQWPQMFMCQDILKM
jgi:hypothetical protein